MTAETHFELVSDRFLDEYKARARLYRHKKSGAQLLSIENDDENKVFGVTFRTPPSDSTGVAHILEHAVLCGSRRYPVKEPFVELVKGSLNTFLNAMTYPDKTCYPVASQNLKDFYNLIEVYLDAVFYPLITPWTLQQEGWHYELDGLEEELAFKGVVYNEMKGVYSSPDSLLGEKSQQILFPGHTYGLDSGGDPQHIPDLTYEQFKRFHQVYYHPSNARLYFYGDDDPQERLQRLHAWLEAFETQPVDSAIPLQERIAQPRRQVLPYPVDAGDSPARCYVTVNWLLPEALDPQVNLAFAILSHALVGTPASPLRKALIESGLGEDLTGHGVDAGLREMTFSIGMKGVAPENVTRVEALIHETLARLADTGIDEQTIAASLNTLEFRLRENNTGSFPRGLSLMLRSLSTWLHDGDPLAALAYEAPLQAIKQAIKDSPSFFPEMIRKHFLENTHQAVLVLEPDPQAGARRQAEENRRLLAVRQAMSSEDLQAVIENTRELKRRQETPDSPEALATIPGLTLSDMEREVRSIPLERRDTPAGTVLVHDLFTNGIVYLDLGLDLRLLPKNLLPLVPLFGRALLQMGTLDEDYVRLIQRIGSQTGGIRPVTFVSSEMAVERPQAWLFLRGKATLQQSAELLAILRDVLCAPRLDNRERFRQLVLEEKAGLESALVPGGHRLVNVRLRARFNLASWLGEQLGGIDYLSYVRRLAEQVETDWPAVLNSLEHLRALLVNRQAMIANVTLDNDGLQSFHPQLVDFLGGLPSSHPQHQAWRTWGSPDSFPPAEGLTIPSQVNFVGKGADLYRLGYQLHGSAFVIENYLRTTWLWERVRVLGGAYGGFCVFDHRSGVLTFLSYRDPNLETTLDNFDGCAEFLRSKELRAEELSKIIIGVIGELDAYQLPDAKGFTSLQRFLLGESETRRQELRDQVLSTSPGDFRQFAQVLETFNQQASVVVLGSEAAIQAASWKGAGRPVVQKVM